MRLLTAIFIFCSTLTMGCDGNDASSENSGMRQIDSPTDTGGLDSGIFDGALEATDAEGDDAQLSPDATAIPLGELQLNSVVPNRTDIRRRDSTVGSGFSSTTRFEIGGTPCAEVNLESPNRAFCTVPPGMDNGLVNVEAIRVLDNMRTSALLENGLTYYTALSITGISPDRTPSSGGAEIIVYGTGFTEATEIRLDGARLDGVRLDSSSELTFIAPRSAAGVAEVKLRNLDGEVTTELEFYDNLRLYSVDPAVGSSAGGDLVT